MKIICIHQSADLYGSDRSFLQVLEYLVTSMRYEKITVVLPKPGPLSNRITSLGVEIVYIKLSLLSKTLLKRFQFAKIFRPLLSFKSKLALINSYDICYVNTSVILDFYALAPFINVRKIIHIREIPSKWLSWILSRLIEKSQAFVIYNSSATKESFNVSNRQLVIFNAFEGFSSSDSVGNLNSYSSLKLLLIGRINSWKGQDFVINALSRIKNEDFILRIVGSPSEGNEKLLDHLKDRVKLLGLTSKILFDEFANEPFEFYNWSDVVLVPSKKPEPFGRIAIEAMSMGKPVIGSNAGGLTEIVNESCGVLFKMNDEVSFNEAIKTYLDNKFLVKQHGENARAVFNEKFSIEKFQENLYKIFS